MPVPLIFIAAMAVLCASGSTRQAAALVDRNQESEVRDSWPCLTANTGEALDSMAIESWPPGSF